MKWTFGWSCYCKAWVKDLDSLSVIRQQVSPLFNWIPPYVLLQKSAVKPYYMCNVWNWNTQLPALFLVSSLIFTHFFLHPYHGWVLPVSPYLPMTLDSMSTHTLTVDPVRAAGPKSQRWLWLVVSVSSCFLFDYFLDRTQKDNGDWKQHEHATAKTRLHRLPWQMMTWE